MSYIQVIQKAGTLSSNCSNNIEDFPELFLEVRKSLVKIAVAKAIVNSLSSVQAYQCCFMHFKGIATQ